MSGHSSSRDMYAAAALIGLMVSGGQPDPATMHRAVSIAQALADEACARFGHHWELAVESDGHVSIGPKCTRCGSSSHGSP